MKNIVFIANASFRNPKRGTPIRIDNLLQQISKENNLFIFAREVPESFQDVFTPYPRYNRFKKLYYFIKFIKQNNIDIVLTITDRGIKLPVFLKLFTGVKIAIDLHGLYADELYNGGEIGKIRKILYENIVKFFLRFYDLIFVVSPKLREYYIGVNSNIEIIYGGVNTEELYKIEKIDYPDVFTIGYMGNTRPYQGLDYLLEAAKHIKDKGLFYFKLNLVISGDVGGIISRLKDYGLYDDAIINFDIDHSKIDRIIRNSSVLVIPRPSLKLTEYAYPSKLTEYLVTGVPTIVTEVGPVKDLLTSNNFCFIVSADNISDNLEEAIINVSNMSIKERRSMGDRAIGFVKNKLSWNVLGRKVNKFLEKL